MEFIEAECSRCGETFNPADIDDTEHLVREDGQHCGGQGTIVGTWIHSTEPMPNEPPLRLVRVDDDLWHAATHEAAVEGRTLSDVIPELLQQYVRHGRGRQT